MRFFRAFVCFVMLIFLSTIGSAKILDIIVGGNNQGLECTADKECGPNHFCNQEQYYCVACKTPPKVWDGTSCKCPADKPVEKSDTECVACLETTDCTGSEQFCNTNTYACTECKEPKEWKDNACVCPEKSHAVGDDCICDNPNTNLDEFNFCACGLTPDSCASTDLNLNECMCCPVERPVSMGSECKTCAQIDPSKPVWDNASKTCVECLTDAQCSGDRVCANKQCVCRGVQEWNPSKGVCECGGADMPTGDHVDTLNCSCEEGYELTNQNGKYICSLSCPKSIGMTGDRNVTGQCLCDSATGYKEISKDNTFCECDENKNYYNNPDGSCMTCERATKAWAQKTPVFFANNSDINSLDENVWYCGYMKWDTTLGEKWYNPSTKSYCAYKQLLKKDASGKFYCTDCGGHFETGEINARTTQWGFCGCARDRKWQWENGGMRCVNPCPGYQFLINGECTPCGFNHWTTDGQRCLGPSCNGVPQFTEGSINFHLSVWVENTPSWCHRAGRSYQSLDPNSPCYYGKGCQGLINFKPSCSSSSKITSGCTCPTGGSVGQYCCSSQQIVLPTGCETCLGRTVPNANRTGCVPCSSGQIPTADKTQCIFCPDGHIPNVSGTACSKCPANKIKSQDGEYCVICSKNEIPDKTQTKCAPCNEGYEPDAAGRVCVLVSGGV